MTIDRPEAGGNSPYHLIEGLNIQKEYTSKISITSMRLAKLYKTWELSEASEYIIQCLFELSFLTGYLIRLCFHHPKAKATIRKLEIGEKNPYASEIKYLLKMGILHRYTLRTGPGIPKGYYIYALTPGALQWANERFNSCYLFHNHDKKGWEPTPAPDVSYLELMEILSFNQAHICMTINNFEKFDQIKILFINQYDYMQFSRLALYILDNKNYIIICSFRGIETKIIETSALIEHEIKILKDNAALSFRLCAITIITESINDASSAYNILRKNNWHLLDYVFFITDHSTKKANKNPLDLLISFNGSLENEYKLGSLDI